MATEIRISNHAIKMALGTKGLNHNVLEICSQKKKEYFADMLKLYNVSTLFRANSNACLDYRIIINFVMKILVNTGNLV